MGFLTDQLKELVVINEATVTDPAESSHAVDRITLRNLLLSGLGEAVHFGRTFTHYERGGGKITAFFDDGSRATAVRTALRVQRQGLRRGHLAVAGTRAWFRACNAIPPLRALTLPYRDQARPRAWERTPAL